MLGLNSVMSQEYEYSKKWNTAIPCLINYIYFVLIKNPNITGKYLCLFKEILWILETIVRGQHYIRQNDIGFKLYFLILLKAQNQGLFNKRLKYLNNKKEE